MAAHAHKNEFFSCQAISSRKGPPGRPVLRRILAKRPRAKMVYVKHQSAARVNNPCSQTNNASVDMAAYDSGLSLWSPKSASVNLVVSFFGASILDILCILYRPVATLGGVFLDPQHPYFRPLDARRTRIFCTIVSRLQGADWPRAFLETSYSE